MPAVPTLISRMQTLPRLRQEARRAWVEQWIAAGDDIQAADTDGVTPLMMAAQRGQRELVQLLVRSGADINVRCKRGHTALTWAARHGDADIVAYLVRHGADFPAKPRLYGRLDARRLLLVRLQRPLGSMHQVWDRTRRSVRDLLQRRAP
jgi:ankyrin repeat protein